MPSVSSLRSTRSRTSRSPLTWRTCCACSWIAASSSSMHERTRTRGSAFGLAIDADFPIPGLGAVGPGGGLPKTTLTLGDEADLARAWGPADSAATRLSADLLRDGVPGRTIEARAGIGYPLLGADFRC